jgi:hypothetical protein
MKAHPRPSHAAIAWLTASFVPDNPDRDWENRAQITQISGTLHFHYFGDKLVGNTTAM